MTGHIARFYIANLGEGTVSLPTEVRRHANALRVSEGDTIQLFDGKTCYNARFKGVTAELLGKSEHNTQTSAQLTLAVSWPKGSRGDWLVEKATELNVTTIIPLTTKHTIVIPSLSKIKRLQQLAITACEQSGRTTIPTITEVQTLANVLAKKNEFDAFVVGDSQGRSQIPNAKRILILVGPEGGFSTEELHAINQAGAVSVRAAHTTLRTETAAIALLTLANNTSA